MRSAANTPEAKLQYVHFARQNGTETYTPRQSFIFPILSCNSLILIVRRQHPKQMLFLRTHRTRILLPSVLLLALLLAGGLALHRIVRARAAERIQSPPATRSPVLVELFTSEGCSSCPPADALLARLQQEQPVASAEIIALEEHVDYWDGLGWHDRFSSHEISERQSAYTRGFHLDSNFTPQMVVDGVSQFVGVDKAHALQAIAHAALVPKVSVSIQALLVQDARITGQIRLPQGIPAGAELFAALVQPMATTQVLRGENGGQTLRHVSVVRTMDRVSLHQRNPQSGFSLTIPKDLVSGDARVVVFLQSRGQGPILAAVSSLVPAQHASGTAPVVR